MGLTFDGNTPSNVTYLGPQCNFVTWDGVRVWARLQYTAPTAKSGLVYSGSAQALVNAGVITAGSDAFVMEYSLNNSSWSASVPTGTNAGTYTVYWRARNNLDDTIEASGTVSSISIAKASGSVTAPTAKSLTYSGSAQTLINAGSSSTGTIQYKLNTGSYGTALPSATNAGTYTVYYKVVGDSNHYDVAERSISVSIAKASGSVTTAPTARSLTYNGSGQALVNAGSGTGTMYYRLGTSGAFNTYIPSATNAGTYTVYYYCASSTNYNQSATGSVTVTIGKANATITPERPTGSASYTSSYDGWSHSISCPYVGDGSISVSISDTSIITSARWENNTLYFTTAKVYRTCSSVITITATAGTNYNATSATHGYAFV